MAIKETKFMGGLFMIFISQAILCILVFLFIYYSLKKNAELKEEIKRFKESSWKREVK
jgi:predicted PurR-regulated permease PerM